MIKNYKELVEISAKLKLLVSDLNYTYMQDLSGVKAPAEVEIDQKVWEKVKDVEKAAMNLNNILVAVKEYDETNG